MRSLDLVINSLMSDPDFVYNVGVQAHWARIIDSLVLTAVNKKLSHLSKTQAKLGIDPSLR